MTTRNTAFPTYHRVRENRVLGGVCTGLSAHLGVDVTWVRLLFAALMAFPGVAIPAYTALVIFTDSVDTFTEGCTRATMAKLQTQGGAGAAGEGGRAGVAEAGRESSGGRAPGGALRGKLNRERGAVDWALLAIGVALAVLGPALGTQESAVSLAIGAAVVGVFLVWYTFGTGVTRSSQLSPGQAGRPGKSMQLTALIGGVVLLIGGVGGSLFIGGLVGDPNRGSGGAIIGWAFLAALLLIVGLIVLLVPLWLRLWNMAHRAAQERAAESERAEIASRIHDSVLQTLTMIQKNASEPEIVTMARSQERQLRQWLFATDESVVPETLFGAVRVACGEVEDTYGIRVRPVLVGQDIPSNEALVAMVLAAREAMVNAAKHSGCDEVNVYLEAEPGAERVEMFVHDRGPGFDINSIPTDRQGVRQSIIGRIERAGGTVEFDTGTRGTEVILSVPMP